MHLRMHKIGISMAAALLSAVGLAVVRASPAMASPCSWY